MQGGFLHVPVDRLAHAGVKAHLRVKNKGKLRKESKYNVSIFSSNSKSVFTLEINIFLITQCHRELSDLFRREDGDVVLVDDPSLLLYRTLIGLFAEFITG